VALLGGASGDNPRTGPAPVIAGNGRREHGGSAAPGEQLPFTVSSNNLVTVSSDDGFAQSIRLIGSGASFPFPIYSA
jgi:hypothetical protein